MISLACVQQPFFLSNYRYRAAQNSATCRAIPITGGSSGLSQKGFRGTVHATIEEEIFYPACHDAVEEDLAHQEVERDSANALIAEIAKGNG
jgi:hypothetical protein